MFKAFWDKALKILEKHDINVWVYSPQIAHA